MVRTKDELLASIKDRFKDETDWKSKYEENDKQWREKYRDRFFNADGDGNKPLDEEPPKPMNFDDLFTVEKGGNRNA